MSIILMITPIENKMRKGVRIQFLLDAQMSLLFCKFIIHSS